MKKVSVLLIVALLMSLVLGACGSTTTETTTTAEETTTEAVATVEETAEETTVEEVAEEAAEEIELIIFAAASMTETLTEIAELYAEVAPNVTLTFNFDSSGTLKTQIQEGADCDIFISAAQKQMNQLDITASSDVNTEGLDFVLSETRIDLLENKVALVVPEGNPAGIESYADLASDKLTLLCLGNEDVPVGQYSLEILEYLGIDVTELESAGMVTYGSNVKEVTTQVSEGVVDCGIIYATDAFSAGLDIVDLATAAMCKQVIYPAAVLNISQNQAAAKAFLEYLQSDEAMAVFESVGFAGVAAAEEEAAVEETVAVQDAEPVELIIFAAASMTETLTEIAELYAEVAPNVTLTFNFDSSGTLKTQIQEGADCDIFISAAQKQMNQLDITASADVNTEGLDFVISETRVNLLENKVALVVPEGNPAGIASYEDLASDKLTLLCLGNEDVPVGQYSLEILEYLGIDVTELESAGKVTYGSNVKEVTTQVSEAVVDCGIIYATDAFSAGLDIVDLATSDMCKQVIYPAAVLNITQNQAAAEAFLEYLQSAEAMAVFESVGFAAAN